MVRQRHIIQLSIIDLLSALQVVGCEGTNAQVGVEDVATARLEKHMEKELRWFVHLFHCNELPLGYLVEHFDGKTARPSAFCAEIGCDYQHIHETSLPTLDSDAVADLSKSLMYLHKTSRAISASQFSSKRIHMKCGPLQHDGPASFTIKMHP